MLLVALGETVARAALEPSTNVWSSLIDGAEILTFLYINSESRTVSVSELHVGPVPDEMGQRLCRVPEAFVVSATDTQIVRSTGKAAGSAIDAFRNGSGVDGHTGFVEACGRRE